MSTRLPVAYDRQPAERWGDFAQLILDAAYKATLAATVINSVRTGSRVERAFRKHAQLGLDVLIVSYSRSKPVVAQFVSHLNRI